MGVTKIVKDDQMAACAWVLQSIEKYKTRHLIYYKIVSLCLVLNLYYGKSFK